MSFFQNLDWSFKSIAKVIGMVLLAIVAVTVVISLMTFSFRTLFQRSYEPGYQGSYYDEGATGSMAPSEYQDMAMEKNALYRVPSPPLRPDADYTPGDDLEDYEIKEYNGTIRTRKLEDVCGTILAFKDRAEVIFETTDQNDQNCYFRFKVERDHYLPILEMINALKPEILNEHITTIKQQVEQYDTELDILKKKLTSIEETLDKAQTAYDEISRLATRKEDVETLAKIIEQKLSLIDRLSSERIAVKEQIDRFEKARADQLDRLNYVYFIVNVIKDPLVDWKQIKDSWKSEVQQFVRNINQVLQDLTVRLAHYLVRFVEVIIYAFLSLVLLKLAWTAGKKIWYWRKR